MMQTNLSYVFFMNKRTKSDQKNNNTVIECNSFAGFSLACPETSADGLPSVISMSRSILQFNKFSTYFRFWNPFLTRLDKNQNEVKF